MHRERSPAPSRGTNQQRDTRLSSSARPAWQAALVVGVALLSVYVGTGAPMLTFWDAGEFATAIGTFGIPHPPGTPLYVAIGTALWRIVPGLTPVQTGTLLSAISTAAACAILSWLIARMSQHRAPAIVAGLCAGLMGSVWMNATETEVYAVSLLAVALQLAAAWRAFAHDDDRARVVLAYIAALAVPLHLSALVATPAAMLLANTARDGAVRWRSLLMAGVLVIATTLLSAGHWTVALLCLAGIAIESRIRPVEYRWLLPAAVVSLLAWSAIFILLVRARHAPYLNQGDPDTLYRLIDVVARRQYDVAAPWPRRAPFWLQLGNIVQYADWQMALSLWNDVTPSWLRTPFSVLAAALGIHGAIVHWRAHRPTARAAVALLLLATLGVCVTLNLRAGPSFGFGVLADGTLREARERDYFFALAFWVWGAWMGGAVWAIANRRGMPAYVAAIVPIAMIAGSWSAVARDALPDRRIATLMADEFLAEVPPNGMLFTAGDNDSYPLWYRQAVDSVRPDVHIVVTSLLPANWYLRESAGRASVTPIDTAAVRDGIGRAGELARHQLDRKGSVAVSLLLSVSERNQLERIAGITCWRRFGLVDIATRSELCPPRIDAERTFQSAQRLSSLLMPTARTTIDGMVSAFQRVAHCPGVAAAVALHSSPAPDTSARRLLDLTCNLR
jgi:Protein of unknown function (DUF2723)